MRVALFDYKVTANNPIGSCHRRLLEGLCRDYEFTVFAVEFENPCPERVRFVRVPVCTRPLALLFVVYHLVAPLVYWLYRLRTGRRFDLVQMVESNLSFGTVCYAHFCHRGYLRSDWKHAGAVGLRGWLRYLDHWLHALAEPWVFRRAERIVVPSQGLMRELEDVYPFVQGKVTVIANAVDVEHVAAPSDFEREAFRRARGVAPGDVVLVFVALGHFERKGLALVLDALRLLACPKLKLWVVGGEPDLVRAWQARLRNTDLAGQAVFFGLQRDVRPFLWGADALVFPSLRETFPLVALEAAAAGLPLIVTRLNGVDEFMRDQETGFLVDRTARAVAEGLRHFIELPPQKRRRMGEVAREAVKEYSADRFVESWHRFLGTGWNLRRTQ